MLGRNCGASSLVVCMWLMMSFCANEKSLDTASNVCGGGGGGTVVMARRVRLNIGRAISCFNSVACCK